MFVDNDLVLDDSDGGDFRGDCENCRADEKSGFDDDGEVACKLV